MEVAGLLGKGGIASNQVPDSRFNIRGHHDGSGKPGTMRPPGGMFLGGLDLASFDPGFFELSGLEAIAMDPNQRQMLEVVVEGLENAGIPLERLNGAPVACFVGSYASDYGDMHNRDPEDRPANNPVGIGRAILANRISYCLNLKGPSITIDTACSGSLIGIDLACRMIQSGEVGTAIVAASNLYLNPDHVMDAGSVGQAHSPTALCHTFDASADGYAKAEAVSCVVIKRLADAIRDRDPVRAVIRGSASTSNGRTAGIASPNWESQAQAIRQAYENAGISELNETTYLECHGTGTQAGDVAEVKGIGSVFAPSRPADKPLLIGSTQIDLTLRKKVKSNIGHSEPAAGLSGLIKVVLAMETGIIPGTPLFKVPNPSIDFSGNRVKAFRTALPWPNTILRRASINSFGFGGPMPTPLLSKPTPIFAAIILVLISQRLEVFCGRTPIIRPPHVAIVSANDAVSLEANVKVLCDHLSDPRVDVSSLSDLAYTLSERRSRLWHRAFVTTSDMELNEKDFTFAKRDQKEPRIGFVFTGQGAQWPQMGKTLIEHFPIARTILQELDATLQSMRDPPSWSLLTELTAERTSEHVRQPEMSQPLVTAMQLCVVEILRDWGIEPCSVIGHSSGEIAAAYAAGLLDRPSALRAAFYRGQAAVHAGRSGEGNEPGMGMLAIGLSAEAAAPFLANFEGRLSISLTISGNKADLEALNQELKSASHFSRLLQVDVAYHSPLVEAISKRYLDLLGADAKFAPVRDCVPRIQMYSTVMASKLDMPTDSHYWQANMNSPVRFEETLKKMISSAHSPTILVEIGPSGALAGPIKQTLKSLTQDKNMTYYPSWSRNGHASKPLFDLAGHLYASGSNINFARVNEYDKGVRTIVDLPNYRWNHMVKYWHENEASRQWRFKQFPSHDLIGSKTLSSSWHMPVWHKHLLLEDVPWLRDHKMGTDILIPGAGLVAMALEAMYQKHTALGDITGCAANELCYRFRNVRFDKAVVVEEDKKVFIKLSLFPVAGSKGWHEFQIRTMNSDLEVLHCNGLVRVQDPLRESISGTDLEPLKLSQPAKPWYKAQSEIGMGFGPAFRNIQSIESSNGTRSCRTLVSLAAPTSKWTPQSYYPFHPAVLDSMLQTATAANACGDRSSIQDVMVPSMVDDMIINQVPACLVKGLSLASSTYSGRGRQDLAKNWLANISIHDPQTGATFIKVRNLRYIKLDVIRSPDPHRFSAMSWKPDVTLLSQDQLLRERSSSHSTMLDHVIDLISHKKPTISVLEVDLGQSDPSSLWFGATDTGARAAYSRYGFASSSAEGLVAVQAQYEAMPNTSFYLANPEREGLGIDGTAKYDLAIIRVPQIVVSTVEAVVDGTRSLLSNGAFILLALLQDSAVLLNGKSQVSTSNDTNSPSSWIPHVLTSTDNGLVFMGSLPRVESNIVSCSSSYLYQYVGEGNHSHGVHDDPWSIHVVSFSEPGTYPPPGLSASLAESGFIVSESKDISEVHGPKSIVLVTDELSHSVLRYANYRIWETLKTLLGSGIPVLWVTKGAQLGVTNPDGALVQGLFRVVRREDLTARLTTLDMSSDYSGDGSAWWPRVVQILSEIRRGAPEAEYAERWGVLHVPRVIPDTPLSVFKRAEDDGVPSIRGALFSTLTASN
ncbi:polyketide synthase 2 [Apiospora kogelbergensis]|uniref:polyketide synthase 2 n=1 Tax=Apiospora kogelbergensis TaxID=1337665 RepID=UPI00312FD806